MAAVARRSGVEVEEGKFESWQDGGRRFDLVVSGQAWHWIEPLAGSAKAAAILWERGRAGVFWNHGLQDPEAQEVLQVVYRRLAPGIDEDSILLGTPVAQRIEAAATGLGTSGRFSEPEVRTYPWLKTYSARSGSICFLPTATTERSRRSAWCVCSRGWEPPSTISAGPSTCSTRPGWSRLRSPDRWRGVRGWLRRYGCPVTFPGLPTGGDARR